MPAHQPIRRLSWRSCRSARPPRRSSAIPAEPPPQRSEREGDVLPVPYARPRLCGNHACPTRHYPTAIYDEAVVAAVLELARQPAAIEQNLLAYEKNARVQVED